ncbi:hypothetical protein AWZ03_003492 [Drosophila navojoa]|uniref:Uncharacterized protein n=1 Tax=Drosophila navojoa TaxID=7232 RepID=A0A484BP43_DRONA|nr:hypothetical protein AWZ03_003492 [Drosophila navojoa]
MGSRTDWSSAVVPSSSSPSPSSFFVFSYGITAIKAFLTAVRCLGIEPAWLPGDRKTALPPIIDVLLLCLPINLSMLASTLSPARLASLHVLQLRALYGTCFAQIMRQNALHYAKQILSSRYSYSYSYKTISSSSSHNHSRSRTESDLLTFAQRKQHYESDKSFQTELFSNETRPASVRQLYKEAGKEVVLMSTATTPPRSVSFNADAQANDDVLDGITEASGIEESLLCSDSDFGNANRRLRTRIDAEIEIRLPAAIEDLRKWTSSEALGDVTVTPDCMHHVDTSICTSLAIGDNGVLTPALSPSVLSADAADALYALNLSQPADSSHHHHQQLQQQQQLLLSNDINKDVPLNHRLPSPEEQTKIIALKYPAEVISVNTSGKHFQRMCAARKSTTGCYAGGAGSGTPSSGSPEDNQAEANNLDDNVHTVSRRSRSRKVRGKRRNTIAGIDQKEIQDAANGNAESKNPSNATSPAPAAAADATKKSKKFGRSKSSDLLKKESVALPYDKGKSTLTRLNSLKQWGRNRFKFMHRNGELSGVGESSQLDTSGCSSQNSSTEKAEPSSHCSTAAPGAVSKSKRDATTRDIDDECVVHDLIAQKSESRFSHERKPSYSSSEKSMSMSSSGQLRGKLQLSSLAAAHVKMRETATLNRQRRNGLHRLDAAGKEEQPHSSSGNWSASSESGRASIGSEITMQPKSSASNTSLNVSSFQPCSSSGPPSSMLSRRRFLNTSASSSVTSEGTATPELQGDAGSYPNHLDDETSSAYSCDTEGYYTSFHMDSGLRTLKEEEPPMTPLQQSLHTSSYSFGSQSNQTVLNAENEYELYGRGSTSTTTSSAGTVCTTLMNGAVCTGPDVPERSSSLGKHSQSHSNSASSSTLERSYSSSTIGSTLERTGTIKRNVKQSSKSEDGGQQHTKHMDDGQQEQQQQQRSALPVPGDLEHSECSDLEGVERIERIKQKTALNAKRIPSMCIITPTTSDDDELQSQDADAERTLTSLQLDVDSELDVPEQLTPTNAHSRDSRDSKDHNLNELKQTPTKAFGSMLEKLRVALPAIKRSPGKSSPAKPASASAVNDDKLYDLAGEYVTIADISNNNNNHHNINNNRRENRAKSNLAIYYSNDIVRKPSEQQPSEYVSLNELPQHLRRHAAGSGSSKSEACAQATETAAAAAAAAATPADAAAATPSTGVACSGLESGVPMYAEISELREEKSLISPSGAQRRVRTTAEGRIIYDSDSLKRRKGAHTTFAPGPYVKETESALLSAMRDVTGESATVTAAGTGLSTTAATKSAKLLLLSGSGIAANRKVANVRPILAKSPLSKTTAASGTMTAAYQPGNSSYQDQKQLLANNTNPFYETIAPAAPAGMMMPSPSSKSNSSTGSTATSSSSSTATTASVSSVEEGKATTTTTTTQLQQQQQLLSEQQQLQQQRQQQQQQLNSSCNNLNALLDPNLAIVNNTLLHSTTTTTTTPTLNINNKSQTNLLLSKSKFASMSSISSVQPSPPTECGTQVRVAVATATNPQFSPQLATASPPPPQLPPRMKVNGKTASRAGAVAMPTPAVPTLSIDPIAETQFSISNATDICSSSTPTPTPTPTATESKSRSVALKRNNSYRLANDELKLEMNKENYLQAASANSALPPMLHATSSLKLRNLSNLQLVAKATNSGSPVERKIAKSFERLVDEFSLSTTCIDSSYLKNKSLENFDDSTAFHVADGDVQPDNGKGQASDSDSDEEDESGAEPHMPTPHSRYHRSFVESVLLRPFRIIKPNEDNGARRQRLLQKFEQVQPAQLNTQAGDATPFQRNAPVYWTLQSRRSQPKPLSSGNATCRDDLYATPIRRADRAARAAAATGAGTATPGNASSTPNGRNNMSPIVPGNGNGVFLTSTPTRSETGATENVPPMKQPSRNWNDDAPERLNTCADRIGQSKTTLMDFKKLLLAKSAKTSPVQRKVSAVELLKKTSAPTSTANGAGQKTATATPGASKPTLNSSLKLLDLSGSPKTFANRRMLRQGQFGSPSKTFVPKIRGPNAAVASVVPRTDIMSTTIPEANSDEDHSNNSGGSRAGSEADETAACTVANSNSPSSVAVSSFDLKRNFFLQTEENNFMRGELKPNFGRNGGASAAVVGAINAETNKYASAPTSLPAFETAL